MKKALINSQIKRKQTIIRNSLQYSIVGLIIIFALCPHTVFAGSKISIATGNWESPSIWNPTGVPAAGDLVVIGNSTVVTTNSNTNVQDLTVKSSGQLILGQNKRMTIDGNISIEGLMNMNGGMITVGSAGRAFKIKAGGTFIWDPAINTSAEATLFTNCVETFDATSTLVIKNWYNYTIPLAANINGNFGNVEINSPGGNNSIVEWNQNNLFESHKIFGTLSIDQGWVTLDKSGSITNTTIGNLILKNINSVFYAHNGTHQGSFTLHCSNITNNGGIFYGLNDGNGNITLHTTGDFINRGNVKLINNSGYPNVSNGNATVNIEGTFTQTSGDTRFIYNIATTNSGTFNVTIGELNINGGIFMGQTACHTAASKGILNISRNFSINFQNSTDKFRGTSLSSISGILNNLKLEMNVGGDFIVNGNQNAEVTSSASSGDEQITIKGNLEINGCNTSLNYGAISASHSLVLAVDSTLKMNGGILSLSRNSGSLYATIRNIIVTNGSMTLKSNTGNANVVISNDFNQAGGEFIYHNNLLTISQDSLNVSVFGIFAQSGGLMNFDNNPQYSSGVSTLRLKGSEVNYSGSGTIMRSGGGNSNCFGIISYESPRFQNYIRSGNSQKIECAIQVIGSGSKLVVKDCPLLLASGNQSGIDLFRINSNGTLYLNKGQIISNEQYNYSKIYVDSAATISIRNPYGLFDETSRSAISSSANLSYELHKFSTVEYSGSENLNISGIPTGSTQSNHKYGILKINVLGTNTPSANLVNSNVFVRTRLDLVYGGLNLNANTLTIESGSNDAITRYKGFINSEGTSAINNSIVNWEKLTTGLHIIPFGKTADKIIPVSFSITNGIGRDISVSTRATTKNNMPYPASNMSFPGGASFLINQVVDRWWSFNGPGIKADVTLTYLAEENSLMTNMATGPLNIMMWTGNAWNYSLQNATGSIVGTGTISINNTSLFSDWSIACVNTATINLSAKLMEDIVSVNWHIPSEIGIKKFIIERSPDGENFLSIDEISASIDGKVRDYTYDDKTYTGTENYYRLKQVAIDGSFIYSKIAKVEPSNGLTGIKISSIFPNPFNDQLKVNLNVNSDQNSQVTILSSDGKTKYQKKFQLQSGENTLELNSLDALEPGTYILVIEGKDERITKKLIKN